MSPDIHTRVASLEHRMTIADEQRRHMFATLARVEGKLDRLLTAAAMGRGAFWFATRLGGMTVVLLGALGWAADHFHWWQK